MIAYNITQAEIFGSVGAAAALLEQSTKLFERLHEARKRQKELAEQITSYRGAVSQLEGIVNLVREEDALKTPHVGESIARVHNLSKDLNDYLETTVSTRAPVPEFLRQLLQGKAFGAKIEGIMRDLESAKLNLIMHIQVSNVGLTRGVGEAVQVNTTTVEAINKRLHERVGEDLELRISQILKGRPHNNDGTVTLSKDDIVQLSKQEAIIDHEKARASDLVLVSASCRAVGNEVYRDSLQVNTPIGVDVWKDMGNVVIENNIATDDSIQWNYPTASVDAFVAAIKRR